MVLLVMGTAESLNLMLLFTSQQLVLALFIIIPRSIALLVVATGDAQVAEKHPVIPGPSAQFKFARSDTFLPIPGPHGQFWDRTCHFQNFAHSGTVLAIPGLFKMSIRGLSHSGTCPFRDRSIPGPLQIGHSGTGPFGDLPFPGLAHSGIQSKF